jgi:EAL domain-containing protein (putative c-di-GMP-specific phosphodiesterase class I)/GAF domain-containing protein
VLGGHPAVRGGIRAYAGTPLRDGAGEVVGAVCAVDTAPRTWTPGDLAILEAFAAAAGAEIAARASRRQVEQAASLSQGQNEILRRVARGDALPEILEATVRHVERHVAGMVGSVLLLSDDGRRLHDGVGPSLPPGYRAAVDGVEIGDAVGSCGTAAYHRTLVVADDLATDPRWAAFRELALGYGLRACWSTPVLAADGSVLGTFALYYGEPRAPTDPELRLIEDAAALAGIAIERARTERTLSSTPPRDALTGLWNRRVLPTTSPARLTEAGAALLFIDVDRINSSTHAGPPGSATGCSARWRPAAPRDVREGDVLAAWARRDGASWRPAARGAARPSAWPCASSGRRHAGAVRLAGTLSSCGAASGARRRPADRGDGLSAPTWRCTAEGRAAGDAVFDESPARGGGRLRVETALPGASSAGARTPSSSPSSRSPTAPGLVLRGARALAHPVGPVPPEEFIPVPSSAATSSRSPLGARAGVRAGRAGARQRPGPGVNLSPRQLADPGLVDQVAGILRGTGLPARRLTLEITEGLLLEDACAVGPTLEAVRRLGVRIALDDFGTGYSSLAYLRRFPIDRLKIDRSFIGGLHRDPEANAITIAILGMAGALDLPVVAEGVETEEQAWALHDLGCGFGQGYLFARPAPADAFPQLR